MEMSNTKFFVYHDVRENVIYTSKSIDKIMDVNRVFPSATYGVIPTESGDKMIKVETNWNGEPYLSGTMFGVFLHWDFYDRSYPGVKRVEL